jgi:hypothetical protein
MKPATSESQDALEHLSSVTAAFRLHQALPQALPQGPATNRSISDEKQQLEAVAHMPTLVTPPKIPNP